MRDPSKRWTYTIEEAGEKLGIGRNQAYEAAKNGEIPTIPLGRRRVVPKAMLHRMLGLTEPLDAVPGAIVENAGVPLLTPQVRGMGHNGGPPLDAANAGAQTRSSVNGRGDRAAQERAHHHDGTKHRHAPQRRSALAALGRER